MYRRVAKIDGTPQHVPEWVVVKRWGPSLAGRNNCTLFTDTTGRTLVFKHNTGGKYRGLVTDAERHRRDVSGILASRILSEVFAVRGVVYREAIVLLPDGSHLSGIICDYIENLRFFHEVAPREISCPAEALLQVVVLAWLGDMDRIETSDNEFVDPNGRYIALDFDFCFCDGVSILGLPKASRRAVERFVTTDAIEPLIETVSALSDLEIADMVDYIGWNWVSDWTPRCKHSFASVLIRNRDRLRRTGAFSIFSAGIWRRKWATIVTRHIFTLNIPWKIAQIVAAQGALLTFQECLHNLRDRKHASRHEVPHFPRDHTDPGYR